MEKKQKPPSLSVLTPIISNTELTHLGSKTFKYINFISIDFIRDWQGKVA